MRKILVATVYRSVRLRPDLSRHFVFPDDANRGHRLIAEAVGSVRLGWQVHLGLSRVYARLGDNESSRMHASKAKEIVDFIAERAGSAGLRESFLGLPEVRAVTQM